MDNSFVSLVDSASSVLILLPDKPDFDTVAAGLGLYLSLRDRKETAVSCVNPMTVDFNRLIGVNKIVSELGNKNLTIKFKNYDSGNIEKVSYDIVDGEFNLTVTPKSGKVSPQAGEVDLNYSGVSADLIVLIGGKEVSDFSALKNDEIKNTKLVHVGMRTLSGSAEILSFARPGSSQSELITDLIRSENLPMDADVATNLVSGIEEGSKNFSSPEVTAETFEIFAYLLKQGGQRQPKINISADNFPVGSIPGQEIVAEQIEGKEEIVENPPSDWLQPKVIKGAATVNQPQTYSENKG